MEKKTTLHCEFKKYRGSISNFSRHIGKGRETTRLIIKGIFRNETVEREAIKFLQVLKQEEEAKKRKLEAIDEEIKRLAEQN